MISENYVKAMNDWRAILSHHNILLNNDNIQLYTESSLGETFNTPCVLRPQTTKELSQCVAVANANKIRIFPLSKGENHGYNSSTPMANDTVVIDLRYIDRIIDYNSEFGYVIIEPGVTFTKLYKFLAEHDSDHVMSGFSGNPDASIMGNALDRGTGRGIYGNRELSCIVKEIVLPNGQLVDLKDKYNCLDATEFFHYSNVGIDIDHLFYQSNLAIVTKMIVHLEPIPEHLAVLSLSMESDKQLLALVDKLQSLHKKQLVKPTYGIYNDVRVLIGSGYKKVDVYNEDFEKSLIDLRLRSGGQLGEWNLSLPIHCYCEEDLLLKQRLITEELKAITSHLSFININKEKAKRLIKDSTKPDFKTDQKDLKFLFNLGYTNDSDQRILYWASETLFERRTNPIKDGCGLIYFAPKIPFNLFHVNQSLKLLKDVSTKYSMELPIMFQVKSKDLAYIILPILFNLKDSRSCSQAKKYYNELFVIFQKHGYVVYRINSLSMAKVFNIKSETNRIIKKLKFLFDENNILSPNKYAN